MILTEEVEVWEENLVTVKFYTAQTSLVNSRHRIRSGFDTRSVQVTLMEIRIIFKYPVRTAQ